MKGARLAFVLVFAAFLGSVGCAGQKQVLTPQYTLRVPGFWDVKATAVKYGEPTKVVIGQYGDAVINDGSGAGSAYDSVTADVHVWIYVWPTQASPQEPLEEILVRLSQVPEFALPAHRRVPEQPMECGLFPKAARLGGKTLPALDLVKRPGWRTIVLGGVFDVGLVGVLARVDFEQDAGRYCHNVRNMRTQLQNLLDGLQLGPDKPAPP
ncbi:MAG: hypothetical protein SF187_23275 [Deltaproteobacteria bacterium]|nr:hypothetical protein [Deltaproteobacteria bacterium]